MKYPDSDVLVHSRPRIHGGDLAERCRLIHVCHTETLLDRSAINRCHDPIGIVFPETFPGAMASSSALISAELRRRASVAPFSSRYFLCLVPGIGTISSPFSGSGSRPGRQSRLFSAIFCMKSLCNLDA